MFVHFRQGILLRSVDAPLDKQNAFLRWISMTRAIIGIQWQVVQSYGHSLVCFGETPYFRLPYAVVRALIPRLDFGLGFILSRIEDLVLLQEGTSEELKMFIKTEVK